jgi:hypothetical protein
MRQKISTLILHDNSQTPISHQAVKNPVMRDGSGQTQDLLISELTALRRKIEVVFQDAKNGEGLC